MSTLMIMRAPGDAELLEQMAQGDPNPFAELARIAPPTALRHRVFATDDEIIVVDEWERAEDFLAWRASPEVEQAFGQLLSQLNITEPPQVTFARELDLGDRIG